jgi:hypothetical protein
MQAQPLSYLFLDYTIKLSIHDRASDDPDFDLDHAALEIARQILYLITKDPHSELYNSVMDHLKEHVKILALGMSEEDRKQIEDIKSLMVKT